MTPATLDEALGQHDALLRELERARAYVRDLLQRARRLDELIETFHQKENLK